MTAKFSDLPPNIIAAAKGDWGQQDPLIPLPGYFMDDADAWLIQHQTYCTRANRGGVNVLFLGASIIQGWVNPDHRPLWDREFAPFGAANFGIGGDRTQQVLWRIENGTLDGISPKLIVLMVGLNNLWAPASQPERAAAGVEKIITEIFTRLPHTHILNVALFPAGELPEDPLRNRIRQFNHHCSQIADPLRFTHLDFGARFLLPDGRVSAELMPDFSHPNHAGYQIWADEMRPHFHHLMDHLSA